MAESKNMQQKTLLVKQHPTTDSCAYAKHDMNPHRNNGLIEAKVVQANFTSKVDANAAMTIKPVPVTIEVVSYTCKGCGEKWFTPTKDGVQDATYLYESLD